MHPVDLYVGGKLTCLRKKRDITQDELAEQLKISRQQIQKYEVGETRIPVSLLYDIAAILHVSYEYFFEGISEIKDRLLPQGDIINQLRSRPLNILLIEDSIADEKLTRAAIEYAQHPVKMYTTPTGVDALTLLHNSKKISTDPRPDLIFLDLNIPQKNGMEVLKSIKSDRELQDIPVVIITTSISAEEMRKAYKLGVSGFIVKSFHPREFFAKIKIVLDYWTTMVLPVM